MPTEDIFINSKHERVNDNNNIRVVQQYSVIQLNSDTWSERLTRSMTLFRCFTCWFWVFRAAGSCWTWTSDHLRGPRVTRAISPEILLNSNMWCVMNVPRDGVTPLLLPADRVVNVCECCRIDRRRWNNNRRCFVVKIVSPVVSQVTTCCWVCVCVWCSHTFLCDSLSSDEDLQCDCHFENMCWWKHANHTSSSPTSLCSAVFQRTASL